MTTPDVKPESRIEAAPQGPAVLSEFTPDEVEYAKRNANKSHEPTVEPTTDDLIKAGLEMADGLHENFVEYVAGDKESFKAYLCVHGLIHQAATDRLKATIMSHEANQVRLPKDLKPDSEEADGVQLIWLSGRHAVQLRADGPNRYFESLELSRRQRMGLLMTWMSGRHKS